MKNILTKRLLAALVLCMSVFLLPITAHAQTAPDITPPTVLANLSDETLHIEASDDSSGVEAVFIEGRRITYREDGGVNVPMKDYARTSQTVSIYAIDYAGNKSDPVQVENPYYKTSEEVKPFTPDGQATVMDNSTDEDGKEFYTFITPSENVFYLVIDKQRDSDNVYFLNAVTEEDLLTLTGTTKKSGMTIPVEDTVKSVELEPSPTAEPEVEPSKPQQDSGTIFFIVLAAAAAGGAGYYFKIYKPKRELDDADDLDDILNDSEEPTVNEDVLPNSEAINQGSSDSAFHGESNYDDYPDDDYPDDDYPDGDEPDEEPRE